MAAAVAAVAERPSERAGLGKRKGFLWRTWFLNQYYTYTVCKTHMHN